MRRAALLLSLGLVFLSGVIPALVAASRSFRGPEGWTLDHASSLADPQSWVSIGWTAGIALVGTLGAVALGLPYAILTARTDIPGRRLFSALYVAPLVLPPLLLALAWDHLSHGWFLSATEGWGRWATAAQGAGLFALAYFPLVTLFVRRSLHAAGATLEEAAVLAAGPGPAFRRITMPLAMPGVAVGALFCLVFAINDFSLIDFLNIPLDIDRAVPIVPYQVQITFSRHYKNLEPLLFLTLPLALLSFCALALAFRVAGGTGTATVGSSWRQPRPYRPGTAGRWAGTAFCAIVLAAGTLIPAATLVARAGFTMPTAGAVATSPGDEVAVGPGDPAPVDAAATTNIYAHVLRKGGADRALRLSVGLGLVTVLLSVPVALVLADAARRSGPAVRVLVVGAVVLPVALTPALVPLGAIEMWNQPWMTFTRHGSPWNPVYDSSILAALVLFARVLPFALAATWASLREVDQPLLDAAEVYGVPWDVRIRRIVLPLARPGVVLGGILAFVFAVRELDALALIKGAASETLLQKLWTALHYSRDNAAAAMAVLLLLLLAFVFAVAGLFGWLRPRQNPDASRSSSIS